MKGKRRKKEKMKVNVGRGKMEGRKTSETKWALPKKKEDHQMCPSMTRALLNQNKNKEVLKSYKNEMERTKTPKVPLKLHYGSRLPLKSLQSDSKIDIEVK